jgi:HK97 family phage major capsid protein
MPTRLQELNGRIEFLATELGTIFKSAGAELKISDDDAAKIKQYNDEMTDKGRERDGLTALTDIKQAAEHQLELLKDPNRKYSSDGGQQKQGDIQVSEKSIADYFLESKAFKERAKGTTERMKVEMEEASFKTTMTTAAGMAPDQVKRNGLLVFSDQRRPVVADLIPSSPTTETSTRYVEESVFTNNAAPVAENTVKPESALQYIDKTVPIEAIAHWLPVTNQQLDDVAGIRSLINNRLTLMLELAEEEQLLRGNGTSPQLQGFYTKTGVQTQNKGTDNVPDACYKAMTKVRWVAYSNPTGWIFHPNDWQTLRLLRTSTDMYIWGNPNDPSTLERLWGAPVVVTNAATETVPMTGDWRLWAHISRKMGLRIDVTDSHADFFIYNKQAIRLEERLSLEIYKPNAFCKVNLAA